MMLIMGKKVKIRLRIRNLARKVNIPNNNIINNSKYSKPNADYI